jgi:hypothetical protein
MALRDYEVIIGLRVTVKTVVYAASSRPAAIRSAKRLLSKRLTLEADGLPVEIANPQFLTETTKAQPNLYRE